RNKRRFSRSVGGRSGATLICPSDTGTEYRGIALNNMFKNLAIWLVIGIVLMTVFNQFNQRQATQGMVEYSEFLDEVKAGRVSKVEIQGRSLN
ncbi:ATP-dependent metallopeptidase FtsH/Yme1/Tma family protein, partial [Acinetobacter baumannii]